MPATLLELYVMSAGADPNKPVDGAGNTCLHNAVLGNHEGMVRLLLARGADPNKKTQRNETALSYAYEPKGKRPPIIQVLEPVTDFDRPSYNVDDFLKMEDQVHAYYEFCKASRGGFRGRSPAEMRVLSLPDFMGLCYANGFDDLYWQAT